MVAAHSPGIVPEVEFKTGVRYQIVNTVPEHWLSLILVYRDPPPGP
jgi:hypothetical protein